MDIQFRQTASDQSFITRRSLPISHLRITATSMGTAETLLTVREETAFEVKRLAVVNVTGSAATLSLFTVPSGETPGNANAELVGVSIPANSAVDLTDFIGGLYAAGTTFVVFSGTTAALTIHGWGEEIL